MLRFVLFLDSALILIMRITFKFLSGTIFVFLAACSSTQNIVIPDKTVEGESMSAASTESAMNGQDAKRMQSEKAMIGTWRSMKEGGLLIEFKSDGSMSETCETAGCDVRTGTWLVFSADSPLVSAAGFNPQYYKDVVYVKITRVFTDYFYRVSSVSDSMLELVYNEVGEVEAFKKVQ